MLGFLSIPCLCSLPRTLASEFSQALGRALILFFVPATTKKAA